MFPRVCLLFLLAFSAISLFSIVAPMGMHVVYAPTAVEVSGTVGPNICSASFGATWNSGNNTCTILQGTEWEIAAGASLTNPGAGSSLPAVQLVNRGELADNGTFNDGGNFIGTSGSTTLLSNGGTGNVLDLGGVNEAGTLTISGGGTLNLNGGSLTLVGDGGVVNVQNLGGVTNAGSLTLNGGSALNLDNGATFIGGTGGNTTFNPGSTGNIYDGATLTVNGGILILNGNTGLASGGALTVNAPGNLIVGNTGTLANNGLLKVGGGLFIGSGGAISNNGSGNLIVSGSGTLTINGTLNDQGVLQLSGNTQNDGGGILNVGSGVTLVNNGTFTNTGTVALGGGISNLGGGILILGGSTTVSGSILNRYNLTLVGLLTINLGGGLVQEDSAATLSMITYTRPNQPTTYGDLVNLGNITLSNGALNIGNGAILTNKGALTDNGTTTIRKGGAVRNYEAVTLERGVTNDGIFTNWANGVVNNKGSITNNQGASIYNYGKINNYGTVENAGSIIDECGGLLINESNGTYTGNQPTQSCSSSLPVFPSSNAILIIGLILPLLLLTARRFRRPTLEDV
jgi:fibronectin-binding autotransporter adhesin